MARASRKRPQSSSSRSFPWRWLLLIAALALIFPVCQVALLRWVNPPATPLMLLRWVEGRFVAQYSGGIAYQWRDLEHVPLDFIRGVWTAEDQRFFDHGGIDFQEIEAAQARAERTGKPVRGASTITMQCARSAFLWQGRSWIRKGLETYYTLLMEAFLPKRRILELYVNVIEMGDGIYGVEAASSHYYGRPARELSRPQCAMLAALLPFPRGWDPRKPSPRLAQRQRMILARMSSARFPMQKLRE